ncbi:FliM/FliN family flagellar motor switch protein [Erwinia sp. MMLR14_017]|uniref:FliM/FliN family flagellar motor switch protein n=1 Tax=Erwinia sp. MMLR14_017 TaxID=3093842 RepID=UPI00298F73F4|nr:FliM/FliN family flagellar motor switch protein [Erwinia sp. MMLR14_017]MDW8846069.1 FliM/FliN family flagellar motor switch protein [Erwinia sp. MMLR14_017]
MNRLRLRSLSSEEASLRQRIGAGCFYPFELAGEQGVLSLTLADGRQPGEMSHWQSEVGMLHFSDAQSVLALMSQCPTFAPSADLPEQAWYWSRWHQQLSAELLALFGHLANKRDQTEAGDLLLTLSVTWGGQQGRSLLALPAASLSALLAKSGWQQTLCPLPESLTLTLPLAVGEIVLSSDALLALREGDVLLPPAPCFTPEGRGVIRCASHLLYGEIQQQPGQMAHYILTKMERLNVTLTPEEFEHAPVPSPDPHWDAEPQAAETDFAPLPLSLSVRCGQLKLTLGELQQLGPGSMVMINNVTPGEAILCHGDYPLAKGELVDVEGRLGLQITHMLPGSQNPLAR